MNDQRWPLQEAMDNPGVEAFVYAECSGKKLSVEFVAEDTYECAIDDIILMNTEKERFTSMRDIEEAMQKQVPDYEIGAHIWHDEWTN